MHGTEYSEDNNRVWDLLNPLVYGTAAWDYMKQYEHMKNGRTAFRVLEHCGEGEAAIDAHRTKAEDILSKARYTGKSKHFTLQSYINLLQGAFTELEECGEPYSERKKVDTFVKGLQAEGHASTRIVIIQSERTRNDFLQAYTFVETIERCNQSMTSVSNDGFDWSINQLGRKGKSGEADTSYKSPAKWKALSKED